MNLSVVDRDTSRITKQAYLALRSSTFDRREAQLLEASLSSWLYETEEMIGQSKRLGWVRVERAYRVRRAKLKRIADGLAWRFLDDHYLRVSSDKQPPGFMAGKSGYVNERRLVELAWQFPFIELVIQNDITNVLRDEDVTIVSNGRAISYEVKSSLDATRSSPRLQRQIDRMKATEDYFKSDVWNGALPAGISSRRAIALDVQHEYYWSELDQIARLAHRKGIAWQVLDGAIILCCYKTDLNDETIKETLLRATMAAQWRSIDFDAASLTRHFDPLDTDSLRFVVPVTAFDVKPAVVLRLMNSTIDIVTLVNREEVTARLQQLGVTKEGIAIHHGEATLDDGISGRYWLWVKYGLLRLTSFLESAVAMRAEAKRVIQKSSVSFKPRART